MRRARVIYLTSFGFVGNDCQGIDVTRTNRYNDESISYYTKAYQASEWASAYARHGDYCNYSLATYDPFYNGAKEIQEQYQRMFGFDYKKACCLKNDFEFKALG